MNTLLNTVELFLIYSKLNINHHKCRTISIGTRNNQRISLHKQFTIQGNQLPVIDLDQGIEYLGIIISNNRSMRMKSAEEITVKSKRNIEKLDSTPLRFNQKIDAIKKFIISSLIYILMNGDTLWRCTVFLVYARKLKKISLYIILQEIHRKRKNEDEATFILL